jgi:hypothetical protein
MTNKNLTNKPFSFVNRSNQEMADEVDNRYPVRLVRNQDLVERVYQRYQVLSKADVALIVKAVFSGIRELLILGKVLNFNGLFADAKMKFWTRTTGEILCGIRVATPKKMRKKNAEESVI